MNQFNNFLLSEIVSRVPKLRLLMNLTKFSFTLNQGVANISDYAVSFHYVSPQHMYDLEFYVYHLQPYGIISGLQTLNPKSPGLLTRQAQETFPV